MTDKPVALEKLEYINDLIAHGIDEAGDNAEVFLAKALYHLAAHAAPVDALRAAIDAGLRDLQEA